MVDAAVAVVTNDSVTLELVNNASCNPMQDEILFVTLMLSRGSRFQPGVTPALAVPAFVIETAPADQPKDKKELNDF